jgi:hypothetical protein
MNLSGMVEALWPPFSPAAPPPVAPPGAPVPHGRLTALVHALWMPFGATPAVAPTPVAYRDRDALDAMAALLRATGRFRAVRVVRDPDRAQFPAGGPVAALYYLDHSERPDAHPDLVRRQVRYALAIRAEKLRDEDAEAALERLEQAAEAALERRSYGFCLPRYSRIGRGTVDTDQHPAVWIRAEGQFVYLIDLGAAGRDVGP